AGVRYSSIWSVDFTDDFARGALGQWCDTGRIQHHTSPARPFAREPWPDAVAKPRELGARLGVTLRRDQAILGVFDEGCMGMYNAIVPDHLLHALCLFKERLSQSGLHAAMREVSDTEARRHYDWLLSRGMTFRLGRDEATELTEAQVLEGLKMYDAAVR